MVLTIDLDDVQRALLDEIEKRAPDAPLSSHKAVEDTICDRFEQFKEMVAGFTNSDFTKNNSNRYSHDFDLDLTKRAWRPLAQLPFTGAQLSQNEILTPLKSVL